MKLRTILLVGIGFIGGLAFARRLREDDPNVVHGPTGERRADNPAVRVVSAGAQRLADRAAVTSLSAIRKARGAIRDRLDDGERYDDDAAWL